MARKTSFFDFWSRKRERGEFMERANQLSLLPTELKRLLGDSGVRLALKSSRMVSLLPPVGTEVYRRLTQSSLKNKEVSDRASCPAPELEAGKPLPFTFGAPPPELLHTPLEDLDPFYQSQKTFIVLAKGSDLIRFHAADSCSLFSPFSFTRRGAINVITRPLFRFFVLMTILINCVFMTFNDPPEWSQTVEYVFLSVYTLELVLKVLSRGFCVGRFSFLWNPWNWLDVLVISTGFLSVFADLGKCSVLKTIPRILKIIPVLPGPKMTFGALIQSVKRLVGVVVMTALCLSVFALIAQISFMGSLKNKCYYFVPTNLSSLNSPENQYFAPHHIDALTCSNSTGGGICPDGFTCIRGGVNPNYGFTNFDSMGWSMLTLLRILTRDFLDNLLPLMVRTGTYPMTLFFMAIVFSACFLLRCLMVTVVAMAFGEWEAESFAEAKQRDEEFRLIMDALKRSEEEEQAACRAAVSPSQDEAEKKSNEGRCPLLPSACCCGGWPRLKLWLSNPFFDLGIVAFLVVNIVFMAMEHYPMRDRFEEMLSDAHLVFTAVFMVEMVVKLVALGLCGYLQVGWNIFESIIVAVSLLELSLIDTQSFGLLRCLRLLRVFRLARWWPGFLLFLKLIWRCLQSLKNLAVLLAIAVFTFSVAGMTLFGSSYKECSCRISSDCGLPRWHMNDFSHSFLLVFRALWGDWALTLWDCMEVSGQAGCLIYYTLIIGIGNLLMVNLFLVLLLSSFDHLTVPEKKNSLQIAVGTIRRTLWALMGKKKKDVASETPASDIEEDKRKEYLALTSVRAEQPGSEDTCIQRRVPIAEAELEFNVNGVEEEEEKQRKCEDVPDKEHKQLKGNTPEDCCSHKCYRCCPFLDIDTSRRPGTVWSNFRKTCLFIVQNKHFTIFIIVIIVLSSTVLVCEDVYLPHRPTLKEIVQRADQLFTVLFLTEMLLKWIGLGMKKYFTDVWCWVDFLILQVSLVCLMADVFGFYELGGFCSLRALIPLRILSRCPGLRAVLQTLVWTVPSMLKVVPLFLTLWLVFSVLGVNLFAGKFYYCYNETSEQIFHLKDVSNKSDCYTAMMWYNDTIQWTNSRYTFDSVLNGFLSLLVYSTSHDQGMHLMYSAADSTQVESQPANEANFFMSLFFVLFIIVSFFIINVFIRSIVDKLQTDKMGGKYLFMTEQQRTVNQWLIRQPQTPVPRPQNRCRAGLYALVSSPWFEVVMVTVICLNVLTLMLETDDDSQDKEIILYWAQFCFIVLFLIEVILKITAVGRHYFTSNWNLLDFTVTLLAVVGVFLQDLLVNYFVSLYYSCVLRLARIWRILHLFRFTRGIRKLLLSFMMSLPALLNIGFLLLMVTVSFAVFGMFNFALVKTDGMLDSVNFETFGSSLAFMFMVASSDMVERLLATPPHCDPDTENPGFTVRGNCSPPMLTVAFFTSYFLISSLLVVHMIIAVVMETFNSEDDEPISKAELPMFYKTWKRFDPEGSQFIPYSELSDLCDALEEPMRIPKPNSITLTHMDLPLVSGDRVHWKDILEAVAAQVSCDSSHLETIRSGMEEKFPSEVTYEPISSSRRRKQEEVAALVILRWYRKKRLAHHNQYS